MSAPPTRFSATKIRLNRLARRILWPRPSLYFPFGIARKRGNVFGPEVDFYISGYPRCGNTFARSAFLSTNPGVRVRSHRHIPAFVLHLVRDRVPGMVLIRSPLDAAVSWAIHENQTLEEAIAYWNDYYQTLLPVREELFMARFEDVTADFGAVIKALNRRWGSSFIPFDHTPENAAQCFLMTEEEHRTPGGTIREMQVCRPSPQRRMVKETHLRELSQSPFLREELARAREIYDAFVSYKGKEERRASTQLMPEEPGGAPAALPVRAM